MKALHARYGERWFAAGELQSEVADAPGIHRVSKILDGSIHYEIRHLRLGPVDEAIGAVKIAVVINVKPDAEGLWLEIAYFPGLVATAVLLFTQKGSLNEEIDDCTRMTRVREATRGGRRFHNAVDCRTGPALVKNRKHSLAHNNR